MRRLVLMLVPAVVALTIAVTAGAGTSTYAGPRYWYPGEAAGSSYGSWFYNFFTKYEGGRDTTVTFIDNVTYSWHRTVRNTSRDQYTWWSSSVTRKGHCISHTGYFNGSCWVAT